MQRFSYKRIGAHGLALALFALMVLPVIPQLVNAQANTQGLGVSVDNSNNPDINALDAFATDQATLGTDSFVTGSNALNSAAAAGNQISPTNAAAPNPNPVSTTDSKTGKKGIGADYGIGSFLGNILLMIGAFFTWLGGMILDTAVTQFIVNMGGWVRGNFGNTINTTWTIVRDVCNLAFIFGFIYIGIATIIDSDSAGTKRRLSQIIIGAILINFSLFFTKVIIDVGNVFAVQIYNQMVGTNAGIAATLTDISSLTSIWKVGVPDELAQMTAGGNIAFFVGATAFLLVAGFVFAAGGIMIIIRFVALIFMMIFSPVFFAASIFPQTAKYSSQLLSKLIAYSFFAPVFLFCIFISIQVSQSASSQFGIGSKTFFAALAASGTGDTFNMVVNFLLTIMFLIFSLMIAKEMSVRGAGTAITWGNAIVNSARGYAGRTAGSMTFGLAARAGRSSVGAAGQAVTSSKFVQSRLKDKGLGGFIGRSVAMAGKKTSEASFDARRVGGVGKKLGIGEGKKGGYVQTLKDAEKKEQEYAKLIEGDEGLYKENGVEEQLKLYKAKIKERNDALVSLSNTTDEAERAAITQNILRLGGQIDGIEKADTVKNMPKKPEDFAGDDVEWERNWKRIQKFAQVRKLVSIIPKEEYAANLERRGDSLPPIVKTLYQWTIRSKAENKAAAKAILKDLKKSKDDKLIEAVSSAGKPKDEG